VKLSAYFASWLWALWLLISPALGISSASWCSLQSCLGLGNIAWKLDVDPFGRSRKIVVGIPKILGGGVGSAITEARVLRNARRGRDNFVMAIGKIGCWDSIKLSQTCVDNGWVTADLILWNGIVGNGKPLLLGCLCCNDRWSVCDCCSLDLSIYRVLANANLDIEL
jgi:hypothetical protein